MNLGKREVYYHYGTALDRVAVLVGADKKVTVHRDQLDGKACWIVEWL